MARINFEETQRLASVRWLWLAATLPLLIPLYVTSQELPSNEEVAKMMGITFLAWIPVLVIMLTIKLKVRVDENGLHYRLMPKTFGWKDVSSQSITQVEVRIPETLIEKITVGYSRNPFTKTIRVNITGKSFVVVKLKDDSTLKIGSERAEELRTALKKLITDNTNT